MEDSVPSNFQYLPAELLQKILGYLTITEKFRTYNALRYTFANDVILQTIIENTNMSIRLSPTYEKIDPIDYYEKWVSPPEFTALLNTVNPIALTFESDNEDIFFPEDMYKQYNLESHYVRKLTFRHIIDTNDLTFRFPNLQKLSISGPDNTPANMSLNMFQIILQATTITYIHLENTFISPGIFELLSNLNLTEIKLIDSTTTPDCNCIETYARIFFRKTRNLERVTIKWFDMTRYNDILSKFIFRLPAKNNRINYLEIHYVRGDIIFENELAQWPSLQEIKIYLGYDLYAGNLMETLNGRTNLRKITIAQANSEFHRETFNGDNHITILHKIGASVHRNIIETEFNAIIVPPEFDN